MTVLSPHARNLATAFFTCASLIEEAAMTSAAAGAAAVSTSPDSRPSRSNNTIQRSKILTHHNSGMRIFGAAAVPYTGVLWYLMTDSADIKEYARHKYGSKILMHDSKLINMLGNKQGYDMRSFADVIGEQWCGSLCDYFVTSASSGLGMQAAFRSQHVDRRVFPIETKQLVAKRVTATGKSLEVKVFSNLSEYRHRHQESQRRWNVEDEEEGEREEGAILATDLCRAERVADFGLRYSGI